MVASGFASMTSFIDFDGVGVDNFYEIFDDIANKIGDSTPLHYVKIQLSSYKIN